MRRERSILILGDHNAHMSSLAERVRNLGHRTVRLKTPEEAIELAEQRRVVYGAGLIEASGLAFNLPDALEAVRCRSNSPAMTFIATGREADEEERSVLRDAGVERALWSPVEDAALRFQLNAALAPRQVELLRSEVRAPFEIPATIRAGGRTKRASIYSLSAGGAFLETPRPSMSGATIEVAFLTAHGELSVSAQVLYTNVPGNLKQSVLPMGMAVRFEGIESEAWESIRSIVDIRSSSLCV